MVSGGIVEEKGSNSTESAPNLSNRPSCLVELLVEEMQSKVRSCRCNRSNEQLESSKLHN